MGTRRRHDEDRVGVLGVPTHLVPQRSGAAAHVAVRAADEPAGAVDAERVRVHLRTRV